MLFASVKGGESDFPRFGEAPMKAARADAGGFWPGRKLEKDRNPVWIFRFLPPPMGQTLPRSAGDDGSATRQHQKLICMKRSSGPSSGIAGTCRFPAESSLNVPDRETA